ncbi:MAG: hypothetical protein JST61_03730 [Acidobacteria bacterium]|nr:hypothetical protein [Acidobacteriota bacterium]
MPQMRGSEVNLAERIDDMLHGLCQPLTVLQCRLALGELNGEPEAMRSAIGEALGECVRMNQAVGAMREMLLEAGSGEQQGV